MRIGRRAVDRVVQGQLLGSGSAASNSRTSSTQPWNGYSPFSDPISTRLTGDFKPAGESVFASVFHTRSFDRRIDLPARAVVDKHDVIPRARRPGQSVRAEPGEAAAVLPAEVQPVVVDFHLDAVVQRAVGKREQLPAGPALGLDPHRHGEIAQLAQRRRVPVEADRACRRETHARPTLPGTERSAWPHPACRATGWARHRPRVLAVLVEFPIADQASCFWPLSA